MLAHPGACPLIISTACTMCNAYFINDVIKLSLSHVETHKIVLKFTQLVGATYYDKLVAMKEFCKKMILPNTTATKAYRCACSVLTKPANVVITSNNNTTGIKKKFVTKIPKISANRRNVGMKSEKVKANGKGQFTTKTKNNEYKNHWCWGPQCNVPGCMARQN